MITSITLNNFKGISNYLKIDLKPITLLFGANSSGKSTIIQAIHYVREILERHNLDPDRTLYGGDAIELGGFKNLVNKRDLTKPIVIRIDLDLSNIDLPEYGGDYEKAPVTNISRLSKSAWIELKIEWSRFKEQPVLMSYDVGINGIEIAGIYTNDGSVHIPKCNMFHPLFIEGDHNVDDNGSREVETLWVEFQSEDLKSALPQWGKSLRVEAHDVFYENLQYEYGQFNRIFSQVLIGPGEVLKKLLQGFRYLGPLRQVLPRNHHPALTRNELLWADGQAAWDLLHQRDQAFLNEVSDWLSSEEKLNTGYSLGMKTYKELNMDSALTAILNRGVEIDDIETIKAEIEKLPVNKRLFLIEEQTGLEVLPQDVGIGISQLLPVVVAAMSSSGDNIIAIEQPELHIHPAIQARLGDLFIDRISKSNAVFLIETHSEHLILRMLRRIRETHDGELPANAPALTPDKVSVIYVEQTAEGVKPYLLRIDETGEFIDRWPKGFFEERAEELF